MVMFTSEDATVEQKCNIARELLDGFAEVPVFFLRAISSPLVCHLPILHGPPLIFIVASFGWNRIYPRLSF